jgi:predicted nucleic acid-binding protein
VRYVVLDTDVASRSIKRKLPPSMKAQLSSQAWCVTFVTVGELWKWAHLRAWGRQRRLELEGWLDRVVVLESDEAVARTWGRISSAGYVRGRPRPGNDTWIAACCLARALPLATYDLKDYIDFVQHEGLTLVES